MSVWYSFLNLKNIICFCIYANLCISSTWICILKNYTMQVSHENSPTSRYFRVCENVNIISKQIHDNLGQHSLLLSRTIQGVRTTEDSGRWRAFVAAHPVRWSPATCPGQLLPTWSPFLFSWSSRCWQSLFATKGAKCWILLSASLTMRTWTYEIEKETCWVSRKDFFFSSGKRETSRDRAHPLTFFLSLNIDVWEYDGWSCGCHLATMRGKPREAHKSCPSDLTSSDHCICQLWNCLIE